MCCLNLGLITAVLITLTSKRQISCQNWWKEWLIQLQKSSFLKASINKTKTAKKKKKLAMSHVVLETRWLFPLERYVWLILMSYIFKMTYVNNLEKKRVISYEAAAAPNIIVLFQTEFFFSSSLLCFWLFIFITQQVISLFDRLVRTRDGFDKMISKEVIF